MRLSHQAVQGQAEHWAETDVDNSIANGRQRLEAWNELFCRAPCDEGFAVMKKKRRNGKDTRSDNIRMTVSIVTEKNVKVAK